MTLPLSTSLQCGAAHLDAGYMANNPDVQLVPGDDDTWIRIGEYSVYHCAGPAILELQLNLNHFTQVTILLTPSSNRETLKNLDPLENQKIARF